MAVSVAAVSVIGAGRLSTSTRPLADVMAHVLGGRAEAVIAVIALVSTTNTSLLALTAGSRLLYGMADTGALPPRLATLSRRGQVPKAAIVVAAAGAVGCALVGDLTLVASVTDFAVYVVFLAVNGTVIALRFKAPDQARGFRAPGTIKRVPVTAVLGFVAAVAMLPQLEPSAIWLGIGLLAVGALAYSVLRPDRLRSEVR
jgi:APA family basic amino acid/polyamine antiporter